MIKFMKTIYYINLARKEWNSGNKKVALSYYKSAKHFKSIESRK